MNIFLKSLTYIATFGAGIVAGGFAVQKYLEKRLLGNMELANKMISQMNEQQTKPAEVEMQTPGQGLNIVSPSSVNPQTLVFNPTQKAAITPLNLTAEALGHKGLVI